MQNRRKMSSKLEKRRELYHKHLALKRILLKYEFSQEGGVLVIPPPKKTLIF